MLSLLLRKEQLLRTTHPMTGHRLSEMLPGVLSTISCARARCAGFAFSALAHAIYHVTVVGMCISCTSVAAKCDVSVMPVSS